MSCKHAARNFGPPETTLLDIHGTYRKASICIKQNFQSPPCHGRKQVTLTCLLSDRATQERCFANPTQQCTRNLPLFNNPILGSQTRIYFSARFITAQTAKKILPHQYTPPVIQKRKRSPFLESGPKLADRAARLAFKSVKSSISEMVSF